MCSHSRKPSEFLHWQLAAYVNIDFRFLFAYFSYSTLICQSIKWFCGVFGQKLLLQSHWINSTNPLGDRVIFCVRIWQTNRLWSIGNFRGMIFGFGCEQSLRNHRAQAAREALEFLFIKVHTIVAWIARARHASWELVHFCSESKKVLGLYSFFDLKSKNIQLDCSLVSSNLYTTKLHIKLMFDSKLYARDKQFIITIKALKINYEKIKNILDSDRNGRPLSTELYFFFVVCGMHRSPAFIPNISGI